MPMAHAAPVDVSSVLGGKQSVGTRVTVRGQVRSHVELPLLLADALEALQKQGQPRGQWEIVPHQSPTPQKDWSERWPDPASQDVLRSLDRLRNASVPLANVTTIRATPEGDPARRVRGRRPAVDDRRSELRPCAHRLLHLDERRAEPERDRVLPDDLHDIRHLVLGRQAADVEKRRGHRATPLGKRHSA